MFISWIYNFGLDTLELNCLVQRDLHNILETVQQQELDLFHMERSVLHTLRRKLSHNNTQHLNQGGLHTFLYSLSTKQHTWTQKHWHSLRAHFREKIRNTHLHQWAWFGSRGERSRQGQRLSSSCSWVEDHRTTKPRNREEWTAERHMERRREEKNKEERGGDREGRCFSEEWRHLCLKNSNVVRISYKYVNRVVFALRGEKHSKRQRRTVAPAFRHTLYLLNIWPVHSSWLRGADQPAALSGPENIDCQQKQKEDFKDSNTERTICAFFISSLFSSFTLTFFFLFVFLATFPL